MNLQTAIVLREFSNRSQAELATLDLRGRGIECEIQADDCGGMLPALALSIGVRLLIDPKDSETAKAVLEEANAPEVTAQSEPAQLSPLQPARRTSGMVIVLALGIGFLWRTYASGSAFRMEQDVDFNGQPDVTYAYSNSSAVSAEWKPNRSEIVTMRQVFLHGILSEEFRDSDRDGRFDVAIKYDPFQNPIETNSLRLLSAPSR